jgi:hypothetical protein
MLKDSIPKFLGQTDYGRVIDGCLYRRMRS